MRVFWLAVFTLISSQCSIAFRPFWGGSQWPKMCPRPKGQLAKTLWKRTLWKNVQIEWEKFWFTKWFDKESAGSLLGNASEVVDGFGLMAVAFVDRCWQVVHVNLYSDIPDILRKCVMRLEEFTRFDPFVFCKHPAFTWHWQCSPEIHLLLHRWQMVLNSSEGTVVPRRSELEWRFASYEALFFNCTVHALKHHMVYIHSQIGEGFLHSFQYWIKSDKRCIVSLCKTKPYL